MSPVTDCPSCGVFPPTACTMLKEPPVLFTACGLGETPFV